MPILGIRGLTRNLACYDRRIHIYMTNWISFLDGFWTFYSWTTAGWVVGVISLFCVLVLFFLLVGIMSASRY